MLKAMLGGRQVIWRARLNPDHRAAGLADCCLACT